ARARLALQRQRPHGLAHGARHAGLERPFRSSHHRRLERESGRTAYVGRKRCILGGRISSNGRHPQTDSNIAREPHGGIFENDVDRPLLHPLLTLLFGPSILVPIRFERLEPLTRLFGRWRATRDRRRALSGPFACRVKCTVESQWI